MSGRLNRRFSISWSRCDFVGADGAEVNALKFWLSAAAPELWPFILSGLIVLVAFVFPNGLIDLAKFRLHRPLIARQLSSETPELR